MSMIKPGNVSFSFSLLERGKIQIVLILYKLVAIVGVGNISIPYPILYLLSLTPYFFTNNKSIKRYIDMLNSYVYRILFYDNVPHRFVDVR
jgi:hypothetical protein